MSNLDVFSNSTFTEGVDLSMCIMIADDALEGNLNHKEDDAFFQCQDCTKTFSSWCGCLEHLLHQGHMMSNLPFPSGKHTHHGYRNRAHNSCRKKHRKAKHFNKLEKFLYLQCKTDRTVGEEKSLANLKRDIKFVGEKRERPKPEGFGAKKNRYLSSQIQRKNRKEWYRWYNRYKRMVKKPANAAKRQERRELFCNVGKVLEVSQNSSLVSNGSKKGFGFEKWW